MYTWWIMEVKWIFLLRDTEEAYVCNIIGLIVIILSYKNLCRPKYCWNTYLWPYWFKRLPHSMQNYHWYFVTAVVGNKIWKLPKTQMVFLVLNLGYDFYNILKASFFTGNSITFFFFLVKVLVRPFLGRQ